MFIWVDVVCVDVVCVDVVCVGDKPPGKDCCVDLSISYNVILMPNCIFMGQRIFPVGGNG